MRQQKLSAQALKLYRRGFTIVELLIVIVVIAILAAITIVAYNGITKRASDTSMRSDLRNAAAVLELDNTKNGVFPDSAAAANDGKGLVASKNNLLTYTVKPYGYCISVANTQVSSPLRIKRGGAMSDGTCDAMVSTVAGSGSSGSADGSGTSAQFSSALWGSAVDSSGTLYVSDGTSRIRKILPNGDVSTLAGNGVSGSADGVGSAAQFYGARGISVDSAGNIYVADSGNHCIRKISPAGSVSAFVGACGAASGYVDATGSAARFNYPYDIAIDSGGNFYVVENAGNRIRKITPAGVVSTLAGPSTGTTGAVGSTDGKGSAARFNYPRGIAVDGAGIIYVADTSNHLIRRVTPDGDVTTLAGSTLGDVDGTGAAAKFYSPEYISADSNGTIYVTSFVTKIRQVSPGGSVTTLVPGASGYADGPTTSAKNGALGALAVGPNNLLYFNDGSNYRLRKIDL